MNCAGAWAASVAKLAGVDLPVEPLRRMLVPSEPFDEFPHTAPMIVDMSNGFHFRPEARGFLLAWNDPEETPGFKTDFDPAFVEKILTRAADRVPCFANLPVNPKRAWAGLYEMTPDHHPILGEAPGRARLFSGQRFQRTRRDARPRHRKDSQRSHSHRENRPDRRFAAKSGALRRRPPDSRNALFCKAIMALQEHNYWLTTAEFPKIETRPLPDRVDVAVIGAGFTGLSAARTLAQRGAKVAVLESETIGWGASSRNGGHGAHRDEAGREPAHLHVRTRPHPPHVRRIA